MGFRERVGRGQPWRQSPNLRPSQAGVRARCEAASARAGGRGRRVRRPGTMLIRRGWLADALAAGPRRARRTGALTRHRRHPRRCHRQRIHRANETRNSSPATTATRATGSPEPMARLVRFRVRQCRFPGCAISSRFCDLDHVIPWPDGPTSPANLIALCRRHHRLKAVTGWTGRDPSRPDRDPDRPGRPPTPAIRVITSASQTTAKPRPAPTRQPSVPARIGRRRPQPSRSTRHPPPRRCLRANVRLSPRADERLDDLTRLVRIPPFWRRQRVFRTNLNHITVIHPQLGEVCGSRSGGVA